MRCALDGPAATETIGENHQWPTDSLGVGHSGSRAGGAPPSDLRDWSVGDRRPGGPGDPATRFEVVSLNACLLEQNWS